MENTDKKLEEKIKALFKEQEKKDNLKHYLEMYKAIDEFNKKGIELGRRFFKNKRYAKEIKAPITEFDEYEIIDHPDDSFGECIYSLIKQTVEYENSVFKQYENFCTIDVKKADFPDLKLKIKIKYNELFEALHFFYKSKITEYIENQTK